MHIIGEDRMTSKLKVKIETLDWIKNDDRYNVLTSHDGRQWSGGCCMTLEDIAELRDKLSEFLLSKGIINTKSSWKDIATAPRDRTEILAFREDAGMFIARWDSAVSFLTDDEIEALNMSDDDLHAEDWFCADFTHGSRLDGDLAPTHWTPLPEILKQQAE